MSRSVGALVPLGVSWLCRASDMPALRPSVQWLWTERLRGALFHDPAILPMRPRHLTPGTGTSASGQPLSVVGEACLLLLPDADGEGGRRPGARSPTRS
jgi:hypothetical protein